MLPGLPQVAAPATAALIVLGLAACGGGGGGATTDHGSGTTAGASTSSYSSSSLTASTTATAAAHARDGQDPARSGCASTAEDVPRTGVQLRRADDRPFAVVLLRRSRPCGSAWGVALGVPEGQGYTLTLDTVHRPGSAMSSVVTAGPFPRTGVIGRELVERHGCVLARATVRQGGVVVGRAETPCG
jgi:hypothetical protein